MRNGLTAMVIATAAAGVSTATAQPRPFLYGVGRYYAAWAGRPWSYDEQCLDRLADIGATMTGAGLAWCDAEPTPGVYNWNAIQYADFQVNAIRARGLEPAFFVGLTPAWAALRPDLPPHRTPPAEAYAEEFAAFHRFVAGRYRGKVRYYFFWNEPNGCSWLNEDCANAESYPLYTQWLIRCSQAIKEVDPAAQVIGGNLDYHIGVSEGWRYVRGMYEHGAGPHIDGISIHPYDWNGTIHWQAILDTRDVMVEFGDAQKGIWLTEYGWNTGTEQERADKLTQVLTELKRPQWSFVVQANYLVLNDGPGVEGYGMTTADLSPRPMYYAFRNLDRTFPDAVDFEADLLEGDPPLTVRFTDRSAVAGPSTWYWEFGDGGTSTQQNPTHTYATAGLYTVRLTVTGAAGPVSLTRPDYIRVGQPPVPGVDNPSFEADGGSYSGWQIVRIAGEGPDNPPLNNSNPWGPRTPFGTHFGGKVTSGMRMDFYLGQVVGTSQWQAASPEAEWQLSAYVQLHSTHENRPNPGGVHIAWEIGWNGDGSEPADIMTAEQYQVIWSGDASFTGNDHVQFYPVTAAGTIRSVRGLRGLVLRAHLYNDASWWWSMANIDNVSFTVTSVPPPVRVCSDLDADGDVDVNDFALFQVCFNGSSRPPPAVCSVDADSDDDGDVDVNDFGILQACYNGPDRPPACTR